MEEEVQITLPKLGESILSAAVVQWHKRVGDSVALDEALLEVSTDKVNSEIPSPVAGILKEILVNADEEVGVGEPLAVIVTSSAEKQVVKQKKVLEKSPQCARQELYSPAVLRAAQQAGINLEEMGKISGTGEGGRVTKKDLEAYIGSKVQFEPSDRVKMTGMRKAIAESMVRSFYQAPHATLITEVDVTHLLSVIKREKAHQMERGFKLTITSFIAKAIADAIKEYPLINSSLEEDTIVLKRSVNVGIAVSVDQGILVPVIQNCQARSVVEIAKEVADLSQKARSNALEPDQVKQGTITMTNFGMTGTLIGIPIIRYPEVAIIGVGAIHKKVVVVENDQMAIRSMMHLSLTFDHRVLDGMYGCGYLSAVKKYLEERFESFHP